MVATDDMFGNGTIWESASCWSDDSTSCSKIIMISFCFSLCNNPLCNPLINELDMEILVSCLNVIVLVITIAYSLYYFTCFRQMMAYQEEPKKDALLDTLYENDINNNLSIIRSPTV